MDEEGRGHRFLQRSARRFIAVSMAVAPWLFGASEPWAYFAVGSVVLLGFGLWLMDRLTFGGGPLRGRMVMILLAIMAGYAALQALPVPGLPSFLRVGPLGGVHESARQLLDESGDYGVLTAGGGGAGEARGRGTFISVSPGETRRAVFLFVVYLAAFLVLANTVRRRGHYVEVAGILMFSGFLIALIGVMQHFSGAYDIYWFHKPRYGGSIFGPFSNRNHFAACVNLFLGVGLGMFFLLTRPRHGVMSSGGWRGSLAGLTSREASQLALTALALVIMGGAVCISLSRGAMLSLGIALTAIILWDGRQRGASVRGSLLAILVLLAAGVLWMGWQPVVDRVISVGEYLSDPARDFRWIVTGDALRLFGHAPWTGSGFGTFSHAFPLVQTPPLEWRWLHAHNDWAQLLAEGGLVGASLWLAALLFWCRDVRTGVRRSRLGETRFALGIMVGLGAIAMHSFADYSLHKPANALLLAGLAGLLVATTSFAGNEPGVGTDSGEMGRCVGGVGRWLRLKGVGGKLLIVVTLILLTLGGWYVQRALLGEMAIMRFRYLEATFEKGRQAADLTPVVRHGLGEAMGLASLAYDNPDALREASAVLLDWAGDRRLDGVLRNAAGVMARRTAVAAVAGAPSDYLTWLGLARLHAAFGEWDAMEISLERSRQLVGPSQKVRLLKPR